jgi:methionyl-tRNA synthetase
MSRFYVTTPIYYVNDVPHLGHAYTTIAADALARYHRMRGHDTRLLTGTDEHGVKIERAAQEKGLSPQAFVDQVSETFRTLPAPLHAEPSDFIRTSEARHKEVVQDLWKKCEQNGAIYEGTYEGLYCVGCEAYYTEKELEVVGDPSEGKFNCPIHRTPVEKVKEPSFFFRLSQFQDRLLKFYEKFPGAVSPESRRNEVISFVKGGLDDLSISRTSFHWGIPVPGHPKSVVYVWFDALTNYLSALGKEGDPRRKYWPCDVHLIGKDILRFHAVYWPAFLMGAGYPEDQLPKKVFAHGWLTINGQKMSKSLKNTVAPAKLAEVFGADVVRFYLLREVAFGQDGDFSHAQLVARYNAELADSLGNLLNRTLGLCAKLRPAASNAVLEAAPTALEEKLAEVARTAVVGVTSSFDEVAPHRAIDAMWVLCRAANKYIDEAAPWSEAKKGDEAKGRVDTILATALEALRFIALLLWPVMPEVSDRIFAQLGRDKIAPTPAGEEGKDLLQLAWAPRWEAGKLQLGQPIFPKIDAERQAAIWKELGVDVALAEIGAQNAASGAAPASGAPGGKKAAKELAPPAAEIAYDEFSRLDLRTGVVISAERVPKSDKLLKVQVDIGEPAPRQVIAGIGKSFVPESLVGQQVVVVANLKPAKLMGLESRGMILAASGEGGEADLSLLTMLKPRKPGTRVK